MHAIEVLYKDHSIRYELIPRRGFHFHTHDDEALYDELKKLESVTAVLLDYGNEGGYSISLEADSPREREASISQIQKCFWRHGFRIHEMA